MKREPFRVQPQGPVSGYRSFGQRITRRVRATCAEVECDAYANGWVTSVPTGGQDESVIVAACDGRVDGMRRQWETRLTLNGFTEYRFPPGQPCFKASAHTVPLAVQHYHRDGDWRGNPTGVVVAHPDIRSWIDEFGEHQQRVADQRQRIGPE